MPGVIILFVLFVAVLFYLDDHDKMVTFWAGLLVLTNVASLVLLFF